MLASFQQHLLARLCEGRCGHPVVRHQSTQALSSLQVQKQARQSLEDAHAVLMAEAAELKRQLATADAAALLAQQQAADNESFACIRDSLSNQVRGLAVAPYSAVVLVCH